MPNKRMCANVKSLYETKLSEHAHFYKEIRLKHIHFQNLRKRKMPILLQDLLYSTSTQALLFITSVGKKLDKIIHR